MAGRTDARTRPALVVGLVLIGLLALAAALGWFRGPTADPTSTAPATRSTATASQPVTAKPTAPKGTPGRATTRADDVDPASGLRWVEPADLPQEARDTLSLIDKGGPFPYPDKDGSTYRNLNRVLPRQRDGYYREYTVPTPGSRDRGARRIVVGQGGELYWTADHYDSFQRIRR